MDELTSTALAARDGDPAALAQFVRESQADVWRLTAHLAGRGSADDLTQEARLRVLAVDGAAGLDPHETELRELLAQLLGYGYAEAAAER